MRDSFTQRDQHVAASEQEEDRDCDLEIKRPPPKFDPSPVCPAGFLASKVNLTVPSLNDDAWASPSLEKTPFSCDLEKGQVDPFVKKESRAKRVAKIFCPPLRNMVISVLLGAAMYLTVWFIEASVEELRSPCVELSSVALKFKARLASNLQLLRALESVHQVLLEVSQFDELDPKLAEYCFFPLTPIFNETQRASAQCLEISIRCLEILISKGWAAELQAALAKQLLILLTMLAGGIPGQSTPTSPQSEGLTVAAFDSIKAVFEVLSNAAASSILNEIAPSTIIDQVLYVSLDKLMESDSDAVQLSAVQSLIVLDRRITDRVVLASVLPRTVSSLTKALTLSTVKRRAYFVLRESLCALREVLEKTMNDEANKMVERQEKSGIKNLVLDESWRNATAGQVKMALANVILISEMRLTVIRNEI
ncbi:hypothetical protein KEM56_006997 [Ascosphaera pollenicola]|nr:hypothetical protein KEM56_006997 [Ascosphaera pollenicola]